MRSSRRPPAATWWHARRSVDATLLRASDTTTRCPWKGQASYVDLVVGDEVNADGGWCYPLPLEKATDITGHYAFGRGVTIEA